MNTSRLTVLFLGLLLTACSADLAPRPTAADGAPPVVAVPAPEPAPIAPPAAVANAATEPAPAVPEPTTQAQVAAPSATPAPAAPPAPTKPISAADRLGVVLALPHPDAKMHIPYALLDDQPEELSVIFHFHLGLNMVVEEMDRTSTRAILIHFSPGGLSSKYRVPIVEDPELFFNLIKSALEQTRARPEVRDDAPMTSLTVTSFSAGFGAVREILKDPAAFEAIDHLVMADTIYAGYDGEVADKIVSPVNMVDFTRFAREAAEGRKHFILTHNSYDPPGYASTAETADYILDGLGLERYAANMPIGEKLTFSTRAGKGNFEVFGSPRTDGSDHAMHLRYIGYGLTMLPLPRD
ncbi:MAG: hypothetical protein RLN76_11985 [Phycisphaeraceae bacterium]